MLSATTPIAFQPPQLYNFISASVTVGNFVNGGLPDIVTVDGTQNSVGVFINNGDGTFHISRGFSIIGARKVAVGDFNGDGNQDLAILTTQNNTSIVYIYFGKGDGTFFAGPKALAIDFDCIDIKAADLNGDGLSDLVLSIARRVIVILNEGSGKFAPPVPYDCGPMNSGQVVLGDFNNDGATDIVVARSGINEIAILTGLTDSQGKPTGAFATRKLIVVGTAPVSLAIGDFNNDGKEDIAIADSSFKHSALEVLSGNGDGTFSRPELYAGGNFVDGVAAGDFDGSGVEDIATVSFTSYMRVYANNGDGTFQPFQLVPSIIYGDEVVSADFNGDGADDLAIGNGFTLRVMLAKTPNTPTPPPTTNLTVTLGAGGPKTFTYRDSAGFVTTLNLAGPGSATVAFTGANLSLNNTGNQLLGSANIQSIDATGTTSATTLSINPRTVNGRMNVGSISTDGSFGAIFARFTNLLGNLSIAGSAGTIVLNNLSNGTISLGSGSAPANFRFRNAVNENLTSVQPIGNMVLGQWTSTDPATPGQITAPSINRIFMSAQFSPNLTLGSGGINRFYARSITGGVWNVAGPVGHLTVQLSAEVRINAASIDSIFTAGLLSVALNTTGSINSITASILVNSDIYAGVGTLAAGDPLPESSADFTNPNARIGSIKLLQVPRMSSFSNNAIAAAALGHLDFSVTAFANNGMVQGLAAQSIASFSGIDLVTKHAFSLSHPVSLNGLINENINPADFVLRIV